MEMTNGYVSFGSVKNRNGRLSFIVEDNVILNVQPKSDIDGRALYSLSGNSGNNLGIVEIERPLYKIPFVSNWLKVLRVYDKDSELMFAGRSMKTVTGNTDINLTLRKK
jgi:hypothetical protein